MNELFSVKDKVIVITGAAGVLGRSMVCHLASQGAKIVILTLSRDKAEALANEVKQMGGDCIYSASNVLDIKAVERDYEKVIEHYGRVDVLVNCAGGNMLGATIAPDQTFFDLDLDALRGVVDLNLYGTVIPTMVFAKAMSERGSGSIINIASESALRPLSRVAGYGVAKAAVVNFTKYLCGEMASKFGAGIRVNAIAPGFFLTKQNEALLTNPDGSYTDRAKTIIAHTPFGRFGKPEELLGAIQWLSSEASSFVSGTVVVVDGGFDAFSI